MRGAPLFGFNQEEEVIDFFREGAAAGGEKDWVFQFRKKKKGGSP